MPRRPTAVRRWTTALSWPVGIGLTSWDYMWRITAMHRREIEEGEGAEHLPPPVPDGIDRTELQPVPSGHGPLFHRRYRTTIRDADHDAVALMARLTENLNAAAPTAFARFQRVLGDRDRLSVGDEYVVRMPGPWDGPVRVIAADEHSFRLATLAGHLEAGQIEFRATESPDTGLGFEIESWARSSGRFSDLLYQRLGMSKEIQLHMWVSFLEGVVALSGGRMTGGVDIDTRRVDVGFQ
jgi:hypothetical protein